jgi:phosphate-selective porin OprO/OprP
MYRISLVSLLAWSTVAVAEERLATVTDAPAPDDARVNGSTDRPVPPAANTIDRSMIAAIVAEQIAARPATSGWKDGFFIQSDDGNVKTRIGAFMQFDGRWFLKDDDKTDQFLMRTLRIDLQTTIFKHFELRITPDFAGSKLTLQDAYADVVYADEIKVRAGKFKAPFGLERLQSETTIMFAERGLPSQLTPNRDLGVQVFGDIDKKRVTYQVGIFDGVADNASAEGDDANHKDIAARVFVRPVRKGIGLGGAVTYGKRTGSASAPNTPVYKTAGQSTFFALAAGETPDETPVADGVHWRATAQGSYYGGPFAAFAEYVRSTQHVDLGGTDHRFVADAWQVAAQWVITGEDATEKSVTPAHAFDPSTGHIGALDLVARIGALRIVDEGVYMSGVADAAKAAKRAYSAGVGIDWFMNRAVRVGLNLDHTRFRLGATDGDRAPESTFLGRVQAVF